MKTYNGTELTDAMTRAAGVAIVTRWVEGMQGASDWVSWLEECAERSNALHDVCDGNALVNEVLTESGLTPQWGVASPDEDVRDTCRDVWNAIFRDDVICPAAQEMLLSLRSAS